MSTYASIADIQGEYPDITFSVSTKVTLDDVTKFLTQADAEINVKISARYQVPISGTEALALMQMIETWLVKHRINGIVKVKSPSTKTDQGGDSDLRKQALDMLDQIQKGILKLNDAVPLNSSSGVKSYAADNALQTVFKKGIVQW